jgi:HEAT repeat protein/ATP/ADP translocase
LKLARSFQVLEADRSLTLLLGLTHFLVSASHSFFDIGSTALLVAHLGPDTLPQVYLGGAILLIFVGLVIIPVVDRLDRPRFFALVLLIFGSVLFASSTLAHEAPDFAYRGLYITCFLMKGLVFLQFWLLAGDLLDIRQAKRLFPVLLGFSLVGGVVASLLASLLPGWLPTEWLLGIAGVLLLATLVPVRMIAVRFRDRFRSNRPRAQGLKSVFRGLRRDFEVSYRTPLLRTLSAFILLLALLAQVLDFLVGKASHEHFTTLSGGVDLQALTSFYAVLNGVVIGAGVLVQLLLANKFISSVGVTRGELAAPITFLGAFVLIGTVWLVSGGRMASSFFVTVVASRAIQKVLRISLVRTSTDLVYNAIPAEARGRAKAFKETIIEPLGVLLGGLFLMAATLLPLQYILAGAGLLSLLFLVSTLELKSRYLDSLVHVLKEKSRFRFAFPSVVMRQGALKAELARAAAAAANPPLEGDDTSVRPLAAEVAAQLKEPEVADLIVERYRAESDADARRRMLAALGKMLRQREGAEADSLVDQDPHVRVSWIESLAQTGIVRREEPDAKADGDAQRSPEAAAPAAPASPASEKGISDSKRRQFFELARQTSDRTALERLVHYLEEGDGATRHLAARALENCGEPALDALTLALWSTDVEGRRYVIGALGRIGTERARQALLPVLSLEAEEAYYDLVRLEAVRKLPRSPGVELLCDSIVQRVERGRRNAHQILRAVFLHEPGMRLIVSNLNHPDRYVRSSAIEALELRVESSLLEGILPLFEHDSPGAIAEHGGSLFSLPMKRPSSVLRELTRHRSPWIRACAIYALGEAGSREDLPALEALSSDPYELARLNAVESIGRLGDSSKTPFLEALSHRESHETVRLREYALAAIAAIHDRETRSARSAPGGP